LQFDQAESGADDLSEFVFERAANSEGPGKIEPLA
jgi:hypothetical protein